MNKTLLISDFLYYNIDLVLYKKNNVNHISFDSIHTINVSEYSNIIVIINELMFDNIYTLRKSIRSRTKTCKRSFV